MRASTSKLKGLVGRLLELSKTDGLVDPEKVAAVLSTLKAQPEQGLLRILVLYRDAVAREIRRSTARITHAGALSDASQHALLRALETRVGRKLQLEVHEDPGLIAGFKVTVGDTVIEQSIRSMLNQIHSIA